MKHGDKTISKGPQLQWLTHFLAQYYNPQCDDKNVYLDQGGELFNHPEVQNLFKKKGYDYFHEIYGNKHPKLFLLWLLEYRRNILDADNITLTGKVDCLLQLVGGEAKSQVAKTLNLQMPGLC